MRKEPYSGPAGANDFDGLSVDDASRLLNSYRLLGDCFEDATDEEMLGRGWLIDGWRDLVEGHHQRAEKARREFVAAIRLARNEGASWRELSAITGHTEAELQTMLDR
jgi:hypothetical protein